MNLKVKYTLLPIAQSIIPAILLFGGPHVGLHPKYAHGRMAQILGGIAVLAFVAIANFFAYRRDKEVQDVCDAIRARTVPNVRGGYCG